MTLDPKVRILESNFLNDGSKKKYFSFAGPSDATKPTDELISSGSVFIESDTFDVFMWDEESETWLKAGD